MKPLSQTRAPVEELTFDGDHRAALCLHGLTGAPFEVQPLVAGLAARGATVHAPVLAGHGRTMAELEASSWTDWLATAEAALQRLRSSTAHPVAVAGFSMGGLLALRLAQLHPGDVAALAVISTPLRLPAWQRGVLALLGRLPTPLRSGWLRVIPKLSGSDVRDQDAKRANPSLGGFPVRTLLQMIDLQRVVGAELAAVHRPALIAHGLQDHTVPPKSSRELAGRLGSTVVESVWLERSYHLALVDVDRELAVARIADFFGRHAWSGR